jgi:hypothetical protein
VTDVAPRPIRALLAGLVGAAALLALALVNPVDSRAARGLELAIQDDTIFTGANSRWQGDRPYDYSRGIGVTRIRVNLLWAYTMPSSQYNARRKPSTINYDFTGYDALIDRAAQNGVRVHLSLTGPAPRWANARRAAPKRAWYKPNAREFGRWAAVAAEHFAGRVDRYSIWNEPNWKTWLGPLGSAPALYRSLYSRGYAAIKQADPRAKVLIGETAPFGQRGRSTSPLAFLRKVTCVNSKYRRARRCTRLRADGYAHHPYDFRHAPNYIFPGADNVTIGTLSRLTRALDRLSRAGVLRKNGGGRMPLYLTEYGYFASGRRALPKSTRRRYLQQAYRIALRNGRVRSQLQYVLVSPRRTSRAAFFDLGLVSQSGKRNVNYNALRSFYRSNRGRVRRPGGAITLLPAKPNPTG